MPSWSFTRWPRSSWAARHLRHDSSSQEHSARHKQSWMIFSKKIVHFRARIILSVSQVFLLQAAIRKGLLPKAFVGVQEHAHLFDTHQSEVVPYHRMTMKRSAACFRIIDLIDGAVNILGDQSLVSCGCRTFSIRRANTPLVESRCWSRGGALNRLTGMSSTDSRRFRILKALNDS
jgi:hypothetical protein